MERRVNFRDYVGTNILQQKFVLLTEYRSISATEPITQCSENDIGWDQNLLLWRWNLEGVLTTYVIYVIHLRNKPQDASSLLDK